MIAHVRLCPNFSESILHSISLKIHIFDIFRIVSTFEIEKIIFFVSTFIDWFKSRVRADECIADVMLRGYDRKGEKSSS